MNRLAGARALGGITVALAVLLIGVGPRAQASADGTSLGVLEFTAPPDLTICFCGSFRIEPEKGFAPYYLTSTDLDLSLYVGMKIQVTGKPFFKPCMGTLLMECPFLMVTKIESAPMPVRSSTWGTIKALYR